MSDDIVQDGSDSGSSDDFDAGYSGAPTVTPEQSGVAQPAQEQHEQGQEQGQEQEQSQEVPKYRQITEDEFNKLNAAAAAVEELRATVGSRLDTAFGKMGGLERVLKQFQEQTPTGAAVEITEEDLAELKDEFPELVGPHLKALQRIAGKMRGTGSLDESSIQPLLEKATPGLVERVREELIAQTATETLAETHPDWESVIGNRLADKPASKEFVEWFGTQPQEYQERLGATMNPVAIGRMIDKFREHQESLRKQAERRNRFEDAIDPKGDGGHEPPPNGDDAFDAGFNGG